MGEIDDVNKEILNTLRIVMSVIIGIIAVLIGGMVARYDKGFMMDYAALALIVVGASLLSAFLFSAIKLSEV